MKAHPSVRWSSEQRSCTEVLHNSTSPPQNIVSYPYSFPSLLLPLLNHRFPTSVSYRTEVGFWFLDSISPLTSVSTHMVVNRSLMHGRDIGQAGSPASHGVERFRCKDRYGSKRMSPRSLAHLKREFSEAKWTDSRKWSKAQLVRTKNSKYRPSKKQKPGPDRGSSEQETRLEVYQLKTGHLAGRRSGQWSFGVGK